MVRRGLINITVMESYSPTELLFSIYSVKHESTHMQISYRTGSQLPHLLIISQDKIGQELGLKYAGIGDRLRCMYVRYFQFFSLTDQHYRT